MEYIDIINEDGTETGQSQTREEVHRLGLWHRTVHIWIVTENNEILLQRRAESKETHPGMWDISCAGHISAGESPENAALKELNEELGLTIPPSELAHCFSGRTEFLLHGGTYIDREIHESFLVKRFIPISEIRFMDGEVESVKYFSIDAFRELVDAKSPELVPHYDEYETLLNYLQGRKR